MLTRPVPDDVPEGIPFGWWSADSTVYPSPDKTHQGKDWVPTKGTPCWFREPGSIIFTGIRGELGLYCQMQAEADSSRFWGLAHLSQIDARFGQHVFAGEPVALTGGVPGEYGAGLSTGQHLHEECRTGWRWGKRVDPDTVLEEGMTPEQRQEIERCLGVVWGYAEILEKPPGMTWRRAQQRQAAKEMKDAVVAIKVATGLQ